MLREDATTTPRRESRVGCPPLPIEVRIGVCRLGSLVAECSAGIGRCPPGGGPQRLDNGRQTRGEVQILRLAVPSIETLRILPCTNGNVPATKTFFSP
jgi:hypothetical protein